MAGWKKAAAALLGASGLGAGTLVYNFEKQPTVKAAELILHPPKQDWFHKRTIGAYDVQSLRRGYLVYKNVCKACHSVKYLAFREMVNVFMTEEEAKAEADGMTVKDKEPDETGDEWERPGKLNDRMPGPYRNDEEAKYANNGALPPDLSYIVLARHGNEDYLFSLLTGYCDPPAGYDLKDGLHYNPYFPGGAIGMAQALYPGVFEYPDGTPASVPQMAKDVIEFLAWVSDIHKQESNEMGVKFMMFIAITIPACYWYKRFKWAPIKTQKMEFRPPKPATRDQAAGSTLRFRRSVPKH